MPDAGLRALAERACTILDTYVAAGARLTIMQDEWMGYVAKIEIRRGDEIYGNMIPAKTYEGALIGLASHLAPERMRYA